MALPTVSPLHKVIDAGRWDAEPPLGRLVVVVHAAFLDAGFVPHEANVPKSRRLPEQVGRTASTLSLRYTVPQLLHRRDAEPAVLRLLAVGRRIVSYVCIRFAGQRPEPLDTYFVSLDELAAAPLLSGDLDDTGRALTNDARVAALWSALSEGLCRRLLVDVCRRYGVALEPSFMSLPGEIKLAIVRRLTDGEDIAMVERTCTELRRLVAVHDDELWKPRFEALTLTQRFTDDDDDDGVGAGDLEVRSWKARYMRAKRRASSRRLFSSLFRIFGRVHYVTITPSDWPIMPPSDRLLPSHGQTADAVPGRVRIREKTRSKGMPGHRRRRRTASSDGHRKKQHGAGATHSPSSRYRWKHR